MAKDLYWHSGLWNLAHTADVLYTIIMLSVTALIAAMVLYVASARITDAINSLFEVIWRRFDNL